MSDVLPSDSRIGQSSVSIETLGCKVNLFESEYIYNQLESFRRKSSNDRSADLCIINTCTVTREADRQSRRVIRRAIRKNPDARVVVTGCYAEMSPEECASIPGVDLVVPGTQKLQIPHLVSKQFDTFSPVILEAKSDFRELPTEAVDGFESRTRAFLQIQQGCDNGCTFCIIHRARGPSRSVLPTTITNQFERFVDQGFREIVICGIDVGSYGSDLSNGPLSIDLASLLQELATRHRECRLRVSSIDPSHITQDLVSVFAENKNICPQVHLSLQSASPIILKRMKRRYNDKDVYRVVKELRSTRPGMVFSADLMVGFPTESDSDFELTRTALRELEIAYPHVFMYSERNGTPAARIPKQVPVKIRKQRAKILRETGLLVRNSILNRFIGRKVQTLVEGVIDSKDGIFRARIDNYIPVYFKHQEDLQNRFETFKIVGLFRDGLAGEIIEQQQIAS